MNDENLMNEELQQTEEAAEEILETTQEENALSNEEEAPAEESAETDDIPRINRNDLCNAAEAAAGRKEKKLTSIYLALIAVLVIAVIVLGVMIGKKYFDKDKTTPEVAGSESTTTSAPENSTTGSTSSSAAEPTPAVEYNVTTTLGEYKGISVDYPDVSVSDEEIEESLLTFLEENVQYVDVTDRAAALGDVAVIDYVGMLDGEAFDGGTDEDYELNLGSHTFIDGFEDGIVGHNIGDEFDLPLTFPENYNETLGGKDVIFKITVKNILASVTPELTDAFISDNTDYETVDAYRQYLRESLQEEKIENADAEVNELILEKLVENCTFGGDIDAEIEATVADNKLYYDNMAQSYYGIDGQTLFYYFYGFSAEEYEAHILKQSMASVKTRYALEKVAEVENLTITDEEFTEYFNDLFINYYGYTSAEEVYSDYSGVFTEEELNDQVKNSAILDKAQNFVLDNASINK